MEGIRGIGSHENVDPRWLAEMLVRIDVKLDIIGTKHFPFVWKQSVEEQLRQRESARQEELERRRKELDSRETFGLYPGEE